MKMLDEAGMQVFNEALSRWRREGKKIGWTELEQAKRLAEEDQEGRERIREGSE